MYNTTEEYYYYHLLFRVLTTRGGNVISTNIDFIQTRVLFVTETVKAHNMELDLSFWKTQMVWNIDRNNEKNKIIERIAKAYGMSWSVLNNSECGRFRRRESAKISINNSPDNLSPPNQITGISVLLCVARSCNTDPRGRTMEQPAPAFLSH